MSRILLNPDPTGLIRSLLKMAVGGGGLRNDAAESRVFVFRRTLQPAHDGGHLSEANAGLPPVSEPLCPVGEAGDPADNKRHVIFPGYIWPGPSAHS